MEQKLEGEILMDYQKELRQVLRSTEIPMVLLKVGLPERLEIAVKLLSQATESSQLQFIVQTLLDDQKIDQEYIDNLKTLETETKITQEARVIFDLIAVGQLQKFLMHMQNIFLFKQMETEKVQKKNLLKKVLSQPVIKNQITGLKNYLSKKYDPQANNLAEVDEISNNHQQMQQQLQTMHNMESTRMNPDSLYSDDRTEANEFHTMTEHQTQQEYHTANETAMELNTIARLQPIRAPKFDEGDVETSLIQLELLAKQLPVSQQSQLIVTFLAASSKLELLAGATPVQRTNVVEFAKMIREELGLSSKSQLSKKLNSMKQSHGETFIELKARIENTYKKLRYSHQLS
jgi:hypothetical protein